MKSLIAALCASSLLAFSGCQATLYDPVTGNPLFSGEIEDNPSRERAKELFDMLEDGLQKNLVALREALATNNQQAQNVCMANIEKGAQWKQRLSSIIAG
jgi:hypothetical protein